MFKSHSHGYTYTDVGIGVYANGPYPLNYPPSQSTYNTSSVGGNETRPKNITVRYWKRIA